jgi:hypothetical protein
MHVAGGTVLVHNGAVWFFIETSCHHLSLRNQTDSTGFLEKLLDVDVGVK